MYNFTGELDGEKQRYVPRMPYRSHRQRRWRRIPTAPLSRGPRRAYLLESAGSSRASRLRYPTSIQDGFTYMPEASFPVTFQEGVAHHVHPIVRDQQCAVPLPAAGALEIDSRHREVQGRFPQHRRLIYAFMWTAIGCKKGTKYGLVSGPTTGPSTSKPPTGPCAGQDDYTPPSPAPRTSTATGPIAAPTRRSTSAGQGGVPVRLHIPGHANERRREFRRHLGGDVGWRLERALTSSQVTSLGQLLAWIWDTHTRVPRRIATPGDLRGLTSFHLGFATRLRQVRPGRPENMV